MPPKVKLHKNPGKPKPGPPKVDAASESQPQNAESAEAGPSTAQMDPEVEQKFQTELLWCTQSLLLALNSGKLTLKEAQQSEKDYTTLVSSTASMAKKRQVMRAAFGDYRATMAKEAKKMAKKQKTSVRIIPAATPSLRSVFVRKAGSKTNEFRFNFPHEPDSESGTDPDRILNQIQSKLEKLQINPESTQQNPASVSAVKTSCPTIVPSDNSFRFNFSVDDSAVITEN